MVIRRIGRKRKSTRISRRVETYLYPFGGTLHFDNFLESQEGLKLHVSNDRIHTAARPLESQEGLKQFFAN